LVTLLACAWSPAVAGPHDAGQEQASDVAQSGTPVSADRVRDGLRRPELQIPLLLPETPSFHVEVTGKLETPLDVIRRELREEAGLPPWRGGSGHVTQGIDVLPALVGLVTKFKAIRYQHAEAEARKMVQEELAEFCSTHDCSQVVEEPLEGLILPK
jgi:hypothetical protein